MDAKTLKALKRSIGFTATYKSQIELLPRVCIGYRYFQVIAVEWLWWSLYFDISDFKSLLKEGE